jgi:ribokinase
MPKKKFDVITMGSATKDIFIQTDESEVVPVKHKHTQDEMLAFPLGAKILVKNTHYMVGGGGANSAVSLARQDLKVGYLGKLGNDSYKNDILHEFHKELVHFIGVVDKQHETNYSIVLNSKKDDRTILAHKDASSELTWKEVDKKNLNAMLVYASI